MKIVEPSVEYWAQGAGMEGVWNQIARATRVCYQSKPREGENSEDFVKRIILKPALIIGNLDDLAYCKFDFDKMHGAMLEHGTVYLRLPNNRQNLFWLFATNKYSKIIEGEDKCGDTLVTTNMRVIIENNKFKDVLPFICKPTKHYKRYTFSVITDIGVTREFNRHK